MRIAIAALAMAGLVPLALAESPTGAVVAVVKAYERMRTIIRAAIENNVALEINAGSGLPPDRFISMARDMGARFTFGSNNFTDKPTDMKRCYEAIERHGLTREHMYIPERRVDVR